MENPEAIKDTKKNQNIIVTACFTLAGGAIVLLVNFMHDKSLTYSLIPIGLTLISWILSIISGLIFLVKRGNVSGQAQYGDQVPLHEDFFRAPRYIRRQLYFFLVGIGFFIFWLIWRLFSNTYTWFPK